MIKRGDGFVYDLLYFPKVAYPAFVVLRITLKGHFTLEAMPVDFFEKIIGISMAKVMRGFELKIFFDFK